LTAARSTRPSAWTLRLDGERLQGRGDSHRDDDCQQYEASYEYSLVHVV
jgi:hypothetical protein